MDTLSFISSLAWPLVAILAIFLFRADLSALLKRIKSLSKKGAEFTPAQTSQTKSSKKVSDISKDFEEIAYENLNPPQTKFLQDLNKILDQEIKKEKEKTGTDEKS